MQEKGSLKHLQSPVITAKDKETQYFLKLGRFLNVSFTGSVFWMTDGTGSYEEAALVVSCPTSGPHSWGTLLGDPGHFLELY